MTGKKTLSFKERRAAEVLMDALRAGSLHPSDTASAGELVTRSLPEVARLPQTVIRNITKNALRHAAKAVPPDSDVQTPPRSPQNPVPSAPANALPQPTNSNDMLPTARPRPPQGAPRKRRRVSEPPPSLHPTSFLIPRPRERLSDIGGIPEVLVTIRDLVEWPLSRRLLYDHLGVDPPRGLLLHGPPGCGKTMLAHAVAGSLDVPFLRVSGPEIVSGVSGESERTLRSVFEQAIKLAPSIIFIDEVDAIAAKRETASKDMERRIISQLLSCIDSLAAPSNDSSTPQKQSSPDDNADNNSIDVLAKSSSVVVLAATNRPESLEPALRRAGRFDREVELGAPDEDGRRAILAKLCRSLKLESTFDVATVAKRTAGYVGADLSLLVKEAGLCRIRRFIEGSERGAETCKNLNTPRDIEMSEYCVKDVKDRDYTRQEDTDQSEEELDEEAHVFEKYESDMTGEPKSSTFPAKRNTENTSTALSAFEITMRDFSVALEHIQPSALREGFATRPNVSWDNVGSLEKVREEMMLAIVEPIRRPELFESLGLQAAGGVLLYGPPGCGKTLLARAVASESGANFISVKGPELLSKYVGDSELAVRRVFSRARSSAPCIIFFDELDALAPRRGSGGGGGESSGAAERVVNMLLTEMDGFVGRRHVFVIAATNRPDMIDPAMLRPGRLEKLVLVPLPDSDGRVSILKTLARGVKIAEGVNMDEIARDERSNGYSGADLQALIRMAGERALREHLGERSNVGKIDGKEEVVVEGKHFAEALDLVKPSVSMRDAISYTKMENWLRKSRACVDDQRG